MSEERNLERFRKAVKLILLMQSTLEHMDEFKGTPIYRHEVKNMMNRLEKKLEIIVAPHLKEMGMTDEFLMMQVQRGIDEIVNTTIEDIHNFNIKDGEGN